MGLNYSYCLAVPAAKVGPALNALASIGPQDGGPITVTLPDGERLTLPFTSRFKTEPVDYSDGGWHQLDTTILVAAEDAETRAYFAEEVRHESGRWKLGYLYLYIDFETLRPGYAALEFQAATTKMSQLLESSAAVEQTFIELAAAVGGVCCWLDRASEYGLEPTELRWLNGEARRDLGLAEAVRQWPDLV